VSGEIARAIGLPIPELVFADLDGDLARTEPDPEIFALIRASAGLNLALDYLPGSLMFDAVVQPIDAELASRIVWFDALVSNVDRTVRNTNMLMWHRRLWLIDHGATLYFHHSPQWIGDPDRARDPFALISSHVLRPAASLLAAVDASMAAQLPPSTISGIVNLIPDAWLDTDASACDAARIRAAYGGYFVERLREPRSFVEEARRAS
jgi:hypothetical protein